MPQKWNLWCHIMHLSEAVDGWFGSNTHAHAEYFLGWRWRDGDVTGTGTVTVIHFCAVWLNFVRLYQTAPLVLSQCIQLHITSTNSYISKESIYCWILYPPTNVGHHSCICVIYGISFVKHVVTRIIGISYALMINHRSCRNKWYMRKCRRSRTDILPFIENIFKGYNYLK